MQHMFKKYLLILANKSKLFYGLKKTYQSLRDTHYKLQKIDDKLIVFESFRSSKYVDSPKAIYEHMLNNPAFSDYKFIWVFKDAKKYSYLVNERTSIVQHESHSHYMAFARAKYWVVNGWIPLRFIKKSGQVMLQCWHGTPLKRLRHDIVETATTQHRSNVLRDSDNDTKRFDYFISPSSFASKVFTTAFNLEGLNKTDIIIETGYPRNDFLLNYTETDVREIKKKLNIPGNKKTLLYAPTWRDDQVASKGGYEFDVSVDFNLLKDKLANEYIILFRAHNLVSNSFDFEAYDGFVYDVSDVDDINELYVISDVLMTDYSSVFFDYANLHRPIIFFMYDLEHYATDLRGFYIDLDELPGDIVKKDTEVVDILKDVKDYSVKNEDKYKAFNIKFNYLDDGQATSRVVERLIGE